MASFFVDPKLEHVIQKLRDEFQLRRETHGDFHADFELRFHVAQGEIRSGILNGIRFNLDKELTSKSKVGKIRKS